MDTTTGKTGGLRVQRGPAEGGRTRPGLTASPQADTASPAANTFFAALTSRSWTQPHSGHVQHRVSRESEPSTCPQSEHRLLLGYHLSMATNVRPYHAAL